MHFKKKSNKNNKFKICFIMPFAYPLFKNIDLPIGGAEINLFFLAKEFSKNKMIEVNFLVADYNQKPVEIIDDIKLIKIKYLNMLKTNNPFYLKIIRELFFYFMLSRNNADVYLTSCSPGFLFKIVFIKKILNNKKILFRISHDRDCNGDLVKTNNISANLWRFALHKADKVIVQNKDQLHMLRETENIEGTIIKNGFYLKQKTTTANKHSVLWVGRSVDWKRPLLFIEIARHLPEENFIMIASRGGQLKNEILKSASLLKNIKIIEQVNFQNIQKYFEEAKCFVNTSLIEGFPNTFIQSCISGTPILSFKVNPEKILNKFNIGYCCKDNIESAVLFIKSLNKSKLREFKINCRNYVKENHDIKEKAEQYINIIFETLKMK